MSDHPIPLRRCATCRFFSPPACGQRDCDTTEHPGDCRIRAPRHPGLEMGWPKVKAADWCAEHKFEAEIERKIADQANETLIAHYQERIGKMLAEARRDAERRRVPWWRRWCPPL